MAKIKNNGGGTNGDSGAPAEAPAVPVAATDGGPANEPGASGGIIGQEGEAQAASPDRQVIDIKAVQQRYAGRIPELTELRGRLAALEAEQDADGSVIAEALIVRAKANKTPPIIDLGGLRFRAKHDAEKRGGRVRLFEVLNHAPIEL